MAPLRWQRMVVQKAARRDDASSRGVGGRYEDGMSRKEVQVPYRDFKSEATGHTVEVGCSR